MPDDHMMMKFSLFSQILAASPTVPGRSHEAAAEEALSRAEAALAVFNAKAKEAAKAANDKDTTKDG